MQRVLVIDSERQFAEALQAHLGGYEVEVELAEDGKTGMEAAKSQAPDLIVLAVELSDDNGYLVGRKLKRSKKLKHVPIIILSNDENADNLFEQHKKTKSKAEDYVRRPASVEEVAARMLDLVPLKPLPATKIEIEGEAEMSDENESDVPTKVGEPPEIDDEIDAFAENAFDALMMGGGGAEAAVESNEPGTGEYEDVELDDVIMVSDAPPSVSSAPPSAPPESVRPEPEDSGSGTAAAARLRSEISELKAKLAESSGGVSSRQFLDLRETLNSKDKEILELRDQLGVRDKEILELRDQSIALERARADFTEKIAGLERSFSKAQEAIASLTEDKEGANKRFEDVKVRFEREYGKVQGLEEALAQEREGRAADVAAMQSTHDAELAKTLLAHDEAITLVRAESAAAVAKAQEDSEAARQAAANEKETAVAALRSELADERSAALAQASAEAEAAKQASLAALREELETGAAAQVAEIEAAWKRTLAEREAALEGEKQLELETLEGEHSKQLATLGRKLADTETELSGAREREQLNAERNAELESKLTEAEGTLTTTSAQLAEIRETHDRVQADLGQITAVRDALQQEVDSSLARLALLESDKRDLESRVGSLEAVKNQLESKLSDAVQKIATDEALLERVRKAMAIGLTLLEEQRNNVIGGATSETEGVSEDAE